jgi:mRNA (guanine-N7-)-methyltransferase
LAHIPEDSDHLEIGNPYFKIIFEERHHEGVYGHAYRFSLEDAVEDCIEWIVYWEEFET